MGKHQDASNCMVACYHPTCVVMSSSRTMFILSTMSLRTACFELFLSCWLHSILSILAQSISNNFTAGVPACLWKYLSSNVELVSSSKSWIKRGVPPVFHLYFHVLSNYLICVNVSSRILVSLFKSPFPLSSSFLLSLVILHLMGPGMAVGPSSHWLECQSSFLLLMSGISLTHCCSSPKMRDYASPSVL